MGPELSRPEQDWGRLRRLGRATTFPRVSIVHLDTGKEVPDAADEAGFVEAMRRSAAESLERAYRFLETQPDEWALLRAQVLCEARPAMDLASKLGATQAEDGRLPLGTLISGGALGFPSTDFAALDANQQGVVGTLEALLIAGDAKVLHADWVESAVHFLESQQASDGAYRIPSVGVDRAAEQADVFWTGMIAGILGRTPVSRLSHLAAAGEFLAGRFHPDAVEHDGYSALIAYAHFYTNVPDETADEALQWCGRALEKGFRSRQLEAVAAVRVLLTCDAQAMPGASFDVVELLDRLMEEQAGDGGFAELSLSGPTTRTSQTFDAMLAIVRLCSVLDVDPEK